MKKENTLKPELLLTVYRGNNIETIHYGWLCVLNKDKKIILKKGNVLNKVILRSCAKPIQAIIVLENKIKITDKELAIICGSHSASKKHLNILSRFMKKHKIKLFNLKCGIHQPIDDNEKNRLIKLGIKPNPLHNNCSGKHLGMLVVCKKNKWGLKNYPSPYHILQKSILKKIIRLSETNEIFISVDGCGIPTFALPVINIAKMFSNFSKGRDKNCTRIISAMTKNPFYSGGISQIDTEIIKQTKGRLLAKVGAEGIIVVFHKGNCAVVKIVDGSQRARSFVVLKLLLKLRWLKITEIKNSPLEEISKGLIKNHSGKIVGKMVLSL